MAPEAECGKGGRPQKFRKILAAIDGSECSGHALGTAVRLAKGDGAELTILHVMVVSLALYSGDVSQPLGKVEEREKREGERLMTRAESMAVEEGVRPKIAMIEATDTAVKGITDYAVRNDIDLIVIGTRGLSGLRRLLLGSVASGVVRCAPCAVMVVR